MDDNLVPFTYPSGDRDWVTPEERERLVKRFKGPFWGVSLAVYGIVALIGAGIGGLSGALIGLAIVFVVNDHLG